MAGMVYFAGWRASEDSRSLSEGQEPKSGRLYTMYHGTHVNSATAIITGGFQPSKVGLLGEGVYVSRNIKKAKCYPLRADRQEKVVLKLKVDVGRVKKIDSDNHPLQKSWKQNGYDCAWIPPHSNVSAIKSGREEDCVWDPSRITVTDVAFCADERRRRELRALIRQRLPEGECGVCGLNTGEPHDIQDCWQCERKICPFERKHVCMCT
ncbi:grass carp reovirus (GCRV)-induced gene 2o [Salminus brasiliensis]|uniref:grass carp reovirus (GCRV)-induced gene 2o n=1 Tax=Salminus brasiliensis TaxID=930266 RepID=UPI003B82E419